MRLESLPQGITGFRSATEELPSVDARDFKGACYAVASEARGSVEAFDENLISRNYFAATLRTQTDHVSVLCNAIFPFIAFVPAGKYGFVDELKFLNPANLLDLFATRTAFRPLDPVWLASDAGSAVLRDLGSGELNQYSYWKKAGMSDRIGEIVFNYWD